MKKSNDSKKRSLDSFEKQAATYDVSVDGKHARSIYPLVLQRIEDLPFQSILDIGCGTGELLAGVSSKNVKLAGLDLSPAMINQAKKKLGGGVDFRVGDSENLPWAEETFDLILCTDSFHHYPNPEKALYEMRRVLKTNGRLIITDFWAPAPLRPIMNIFISYSKDGDVRVYSKTEIQSLLENSNFRLEDWSLITRRAYLATATKI